MNLKKVGPEHFLGAALLAISAVGLGVLYALGKLGVLILQNHTIALLTRAGLIGGICAGIYLLACHEHAKAKRAQQIQTRNRAIQQAQQDRHQEALEDFKIFGDHHAINLVDKIFGDDEVANIGYWGPLRLVDPHTGEFPRLAATDDDPGFRRTENGVEITFIMPSRFSNHTDYTSRFPNFRNKLPGVKDVRLADIGNGVVTLEFITRDPTTSTHWTQFLSQFEPRLHLALQRLADPREACQLWTERLKIGRAPNINANDPGEWPALLPDGAPGNAYGAGVAYGIEKVPVGAHVHLRIPDGFSEDNFINKAAKEIAAALDVPNVRVVETDGKRITLALRVVDPIDGIIPTDLVTAETLQDRDGNIRTFYKLTKPVGTLSCYDDILIGYSEYGTRLTINLAKGGHMAIGGGTRTGKSITLNNIIAAAMLMRDVKVVLIDPNGACTPPWVRTAHYVCESRNAAKATEILEKVMEEIERRQPLFAKLRTDKLTDFSEELPIWLVVVDEAANYRNSSEFAKLFEDIAAQGAKYGIRLILSTQKVSAENVPTAARTNLFDRLTHRVNDAADYRMLFPNAPEFASDAADRAMPQGVGIASLLSHPKVCRMRSAYLPTEACFDISDAILVARGAQRDGRGVQGVIDLDAEYSSGTGSTATAVLDDPTAAQTICAAEDCTNPVRQPETGRRARFCSNSCRQRDWRARNASNSDN